MRPRRHGDRGLAEIALDAIHAGFRQCHSLTAPNKSTLNLPLKYEDDIRKAAGRLGDFLRRTSA